MAFRRLYIVYNMNFERPQLIRDEIYQLLRHQILSGGIQPGARIAEIELCERFGVSRTPIREAIQRLVQEGMLEASANKSVRVRVLPSGDWYTGFRIPADPPRSWPTAVRNDESDNGRGHPGQLLRAGERARPNPGSSMRPSRPQPGALGFGSSHR